MLGGSDQSRIEKLHDLRFLPEDHICWIVLDDTFRSLLCIKGSPLEETAVVDNN